MPKFYIMETKTGKYPDILLPPLLPIAEPWSTSGPEAHSEPISTYFLKKPLQKTGNRTKKEFFAPTPAAGWYLPFLLYLACTELLTNLKCARQLQAFVPSFLLFPLSVDIFVSYVALHTKIPLLWGKPHSYPLTIINC